MLSIGSRSSWTTTVSCTVASVTAAGSLVLSTLEAFSFARLHWKGRETLFLILLGFMLLPFRPCSCFSRSADR